MSVLLNELHPALPTNNLKADLLNYQSQVTELEGGI